MTDLPERGSDEEKVQKALGTYPQEKCPMCYKMCDVDKISVYNEPIHLGGKVYRGCTICLTAQFCCKVLMDPKYRDYIDMMKAMRAEEEKK